MNDYNFILNDGTPVGVDKTKDNKGNDRYIFNFPTGIYPPFTWTPNGNSEEGDLRTSNQNTAIDQFRKEFF